MIGASLAVVWTVIGGWAVIVLSLLACYAIGCLLHRRMPWLEEEYPGFRQLPRPFERAMTGACVLFIFAIVCGFGWMVGEVLHGR
jgi:hypothetical protein